MKNLAYRLAGVLFLALVIYFGGPAGFLGFGVGVFCGVILTFKFQADCEAEIKRRLRPIVRPK